MKFRRPLTAVCAVSLRHASAYAAFLPTRRLTSELVSASSAAWLWQHRHHHHQQQQRLLASTTDSDASMTQTTLRDTSFDKSYSLTAATTEGNRAGTTVHFVDTHHTTQTDLPIKMGGHDVAAQPVEHLLTALVGCTQATALFVGRHLKPRRLAIERMTFDLTAVRDERGALSLPLDIPTPVTSQLLQVTGRIGVYAKRGPLQDAELQLLREQTELRCPVASMMVASGCEMEIEWFDGTQEKDKDDSSSSSSSSSSS